MEKRSGLRGMDRRSVVLGLVLAPVCACGVFAESIVDLDWEDLIPKGRNALPSELRGLVAHEGAGLASQQPVSSGIREDWNGKIVRLPGYIVPLDYSATGVTVFLLVPYVGACVHVPPPPANQLVLVTTERPYQSDGLFEAVTETGMFGTASTSTQLADVGYALSADKIEPFAPRNKRKQ